MEENSSFIQVVLLTALALAIYFLPSIIGWNKRNSDTIVAINFFLGWTLIGWLIALTMAFFEGDSGDGSRSCNSSAND